MHLVKCPANPLPAGLSARIARPSPEKKINASIILDRHRRGSHLRSGVGQVLAKRFHHCIFYSSECVGSNAEDMSDALSSSSALQRYSIPQA